MWHRNSLSTRSIGAGSDFSIGMMNHTLITKYQYYQHLNHANGTSSGGNTGSSNNNSSSSGLFSNSGKELASIVIPPPPFKLTATDTLPPTTSDGTPSPHRQKEHREQQRLATNFNSISSPAKRANKLTSYISLLDKAIKEYKQLITQSELRRKQSQQATHVAADRLRRHMQLSQLNVLTRCMHIADELYDNHDTTCHIAVIILKEQLASMRAYYDELQSTPCKQPSTPLTDVQQAFFQTPKQLIVANSAIMQLVDQRTSLEQQFKAVKEQYAVVTRQNAKDESVDKRERMRKILDGYVEYYSATDDSGKPLHQKHESNRTLELDFARLMLDERGKIGFMLQRWLHMVEQYTSTTLQQQHAASPPPTAVATNAVTVSVIVNGVAETRVQILPNASAFTAGSPPVAAAPSPLVAQITHATISHFLYRLESGIARDFTITTDKRYALRILIQRTLFPVIQSTVYKLDMQHEIDDDVKLQQQFKWLKQLSAQQLGVDPLFMPLPAADQHSMTDDVLVPKHTAMTESDLQQHSNANFHNRSASVPVDTAGALSRSPADCRCTCHILGVNLEPIADDASTAPSDSSLNAPYDPSVSSCTLSPRSPIPLPSPSLPPMAKPVPQSANTTPPLSTTPPSKPSIPSSSSIGFFNRLRRTSSAAVDEPQGLLTEDTTTTTATTRSAADSNASTPGLHASASGDVVSQSPLLLSTTAPPTTMNKIMSFFSTTPNKHSSNATPRFTSQPAVTTPPTHSHKDLQTVSADEPPSASNDRLTQSPPADSSVKHRERSYTDPAEMFARERGGSEPMPHSVSDLETVLAQSSHSHAYHHSHTISGTTSSSILSALRRMQPPASATSSRRSSGSRFWDLDSWVDDLKSAALNKLNSNEAGDKYSVTVEGMHDDSMLDQLISKFRLSSTGSLMSSPKRSRQRRIIHRHRASSAASIASSTASDDSTMSSMSLGCCKCSGLHAQLVSPPPEHFIAGDSTHTVPSVSINTATESDSKPPSPTGDEATAVPSTVLPLTHKHEKRAYEHAIELFEELAQLSAPYDMLNCLLAAVHHIYRSAERYAHQHSQLSGKIPSRGSFEIGADNFFPILVYVLLQSHWQDVGQKIRLMQVYAVDHQKELSVSAITQNAVAATADASGPTHASLLSDDIAEHNYYLTTLESAVQYLLNVSKDELLYSDPTTPRSYVCLPTLLDKASSPSHLDRPTGSPFSDASSELND